MATRPLLIVMAILILGSAVGTIGGTPAFGPTRNSCQTSRPSALPRYLSQPISDRSFDSGPFRLGRHLAGVDNCADCQSFQGGSLVAGDPALNIPLDAIYATNLATGRGAGVGK